jgi:hypothetical protein
MGDIQISAEPVSIHKPASLPVANSTKSFWHSEPILQGHRTTPDLPTYSKYVIIGSGITGTSAAYYLSKLYGEQPLVLEAREACWGATGRVCDLHIGNCKPS